VNAADRYAYRVHWSAEDGCHVGTVAELPSLSWLAPGRGEAFEGIRRLALEVVEDMLSSDVEEPPRAIADRLYSGKFVVRVPPELHRQLALEAAEQHVSLNRFAAARLGDSSRAACG
jgi:predicted HicB family RNase H-like nuclease